MKVAMQDVKPGDVIADLKVRVDYSEPHSDYIWSLDCHTMTFDEAFVRIQLPNEHEVNVQRD